MRRKALIPVLLVLALASLMAAMSYSSAGVSTKGKLNIVGTDQGLLALLPGTISEIQGHQLVINLTGDGGYGLQSNSTYSFQNAFKIKNNSQNTVTVRMSDNPFSQYGNVSTQAEINGENTKYSNALTRGFPLKANQTASISLLINVGDHLVDTTNINLSLTASSGDTSGNPPSGGTTPDPPTNDGGDTCKNYGQCKPLLEEFNKDHESFMDAYNKGNYEQANNWWLNEGNILINLGQLVGNKVINEVEEARQTHLSDKAKLDSMHHN